MGFRIRFYGLITVNGSDASDVRDFGGLRFRAEGFSRVRV